MVTHIPLRHIMNNGLTNWQSVKILLVIRKSEVRINNATATVVIMSIVLSVNSVVDIFVVNLFTIKV